MLSAASQLFCGVGPRTHRSGAPRFPVGASVVCRTSDGLRPGTVVQHWWWHPDFPADFCAPYQVQLDNGTLIFVPDDRDELCSLRVRAWWEELLVADGVSHRVQNGLPELRPGRVAGVEPCWRPEAFEAAGQHVDQPDFSGSTALSEACRSGLGGLVEALLELRAVADANLEDGQGRRPLHRAVLREPHRAEEACALVELLLARRADPDAQDLDLEKDPDYVSVSFKERERHRTALHYCASLGFVSAARALLAAAADPNMIDGHYKTALHLAIDERLGADCGHQRSQELIALLLAGRADPNKGNVEIGMTSSYLMAAARHGDEDLVGVLVSAGADLDIVGKQDMTPLHVAVRARKEGVVKLLVEARCNTSIKAMGKTAKELAERNNVPGIAKLLGEQD